MMTTIPAADEVDELFARLQDAAQLPPSEIAWIKGTIVACDYFSLPDHTGVVLSPTQKYYRRNGTEHTIYNVPLERIAKEVESHIKDHVPKETRTEVYHKVLRDIPGHKEIPEWDEAPLNPNGEPATRFSKPKPEDFGSNQQLLDAFASAARKDDKQKHSIAVQITWWDAMADGKVGCGMSLADCVSGGRLGRDHTLEDVPIHFFRDMLMDCVGVLVDDEHRQAARKAICPELTDAQIEEYDALVKEQKRLREARLEAEREDEQFKAAQKVAAGPLKSKKEARVIGDLYDALMCVDDEVNLARYLIATGTRNPDRPKMISRSVVRPNHAPLAAEGMIEYQDSIDYDCDQVRAMIKIFIDDGDWTIDQFRQTLGVTRQQLVKFLSGRGDSHALLSAAYQLSWEFFNWRDQLGLPLSGADIEEDTRHVQELAQQGDREQSEESEEQARLAARNAAILSACPGFKQTLDKARVALQEAKKKLAPEGQEGELQDERAPERPQKRTRHTEADATSKPGMDLLEEAKEIEDALQKLGEQNRKRRAALQEVDKETQNRQPKRSRRLKEKQKAREQ
ncbi:hypothetical protein GE09DRAFT_555388 [Coniochaeta sp. 2T2.1]|nr:hypothetical protein GE09DRAFT_555388 [Coniochaeta sp. 2T2.1]